MRFTLFVHILALFTVLDALPLQDRGLLGKLVGGLLDKVSSITDPVLEAAQKLGLPAESILNPLLETVQRTIGGDGLIEGTLGLLQGVLGQKQEFDYVVIGGGTAGNAIGVRLAQAGHSVAIIEAGLYYEIGKPVLGTAPLGDIVGIGSSPLDSNPLVDWGFVTEPQAGANRRKLHYARGRCLGGSSALNFMIHHRGSTGSYDMWADQVGDDSYQLGNFLPYFKKAIKFTPPNDKIRRSNATTDYDRDAFSPSGGPVEVGYTNWVAVWSTWLEKGLQAVGMQRTTGFSSGYLMGYHYSQSTIRSSDQTRSASNQYLDLAKGNNLKVFTQTLAKKVLFNGTIATGVRVSSLGLEYTLSAKKEVILSAGAFQSPQLLMLSGIGPKSTLDKFGIPVKSELPGVGQNMWDHIMFGQTYQVNFDTLDRVLLDPLVLADSVLQYAKSPPTGPLTSNVVEFLGWEKLPEKYRSTWSQQTRDDLDQFPADWPEVEHISGNGYIGNFAFPALQQPINGNQYATILGALAAPTSRGNVTIASADVNVKPLINPNWLTTKSDQELAISWYRRMREVWATDELREIIIPQKDGSLEYWPGLDKDSDAEILNVIRDSLMTVWHAAGTCKMGKKSDSMAVIDNLARVFGVQRLRVVDASSFPILPPGHPQSTIYALAEKIADAIVEGRTE